jgi:amino acid adenylation domain-containing protein/thioester reductase-like protein
MQPDSHFLTVFNDVVAKHGDSIAIESEGKPSYTYLELDQSARKLGAWLAKQGIGPENCVGIGIEKSPEYVVALLAIWYCGAAFVPYDPALPLNRLQQIKQESKINVILDRDNIMDGVKYGSLESASDLLLASTVLDNLAYIIFTSGSTGLPKGVAVTHKGIVNLLAAQIEAFKFFAGARSLFMLSTNFDASVSDMGCALLSGATLCFESAANLQPGPDFLPLLERRKITHVDCPPSLLSILDCEDAPECLKTIVIGGEVCPASVVRIWASRVRLVNVYGPTEATVCTSLSVCDPDTWERALIGQPLPNIEYTILDEELYISGICLAREYVERAALTDLKFPVIDGKRMYRTGDRVRLHSDGEIEFLGRIDRQIKMRGLLIEPEEIEARLREHPSIAQAAVLKRQFGGNQSGPGDVIREGLVAFVELKEDTEKPKLKSFRKWLATTLPAWMLPRQWQFVQQLPKTNSGKVDLNALKEFPLEVSKILHDQASVDDKLIALIKSVLSLNEISLEDNFADLGGDSFAVVELSLAAEMNGVKLAPHVILTAATIGAMIEAAFSLNRAAHTSGAASDMKSAAELRDDIALKDDWHEILSKSSFRPAIVKKAPENILFTGATGFLGSRLLDELLSHTDANIYCLIRCATEEIGYRRLSDALNCHGKSLHREQQKRVRIIASDLEKENAGLAKDVWLQLAEEIDTIYHCAALVNMILPYSALRGANLEGSQTIARLLAQGRRKWLHYASTLSVFVSTDRNSGTLYESDDLSETQQVWGGYAQSKWAAEVFLRSLNNAAGDISYYRLGLIVNDMDGGKPPKSDFLAMFVSGIKLLGCVPRFDRDLFVDVTPVDYAARAMLQLSFADQRENKALTYHIANPRPLHLRELIDAIRSGGAEVEEVSIDCFNEKVKVAVAQGSFGPTESAACLALCRILGTDSFTFDRMRSFDLFQATDVTFDTRTTASRLNFACPSATDWAAAVLAGRFNY